MRIRRAIPAVLVVAAIGLSAVPAISFAPAPAEAGRAADEFQVDGVHSSLFFTISHLGVSNFYGRFNNLGGSFRLDAENPSNSNLQLQVDARDVDTGNANRDEHLRSPDFFNAREFPTIRFVSTAVTRNGSGDFEVKGNLTLHGVTKEITVTINDFKTADAGARFGHRGGFETAFTIKRTDFGMDTYVKEGTLGDEVTVKAAVEGVRR